MTLPLIYTIGVYGSSENDFFQKLIDNKIDLFCDIRRRRAVRGREYSFVNSKRLQDKLEALSIKYIHEISLAPTKEVITVQEKSDAKNKIPRRQREELSIAFEIAYCEKVLSKFDLKKFIHDIETLNTTRVVLFCVEKLPAACHRSLVTDKIKAIFPKIKITDL
jgi:uncharacterized protein (DUF488 family)